MMSGEEDAKGPILNVAAGINNVTCVVRKDSDLMARAQRIKFVFAVTTERFDESLEIPDERFDVTGIL